MVLTVSNIPDTGSGAQVCPAKPGHSRAPLRNVAARQQLAVRQYLSRNDRE
jgi:hypothetical protein